MSTPLIVDGRNLLDPALVQAAGFVYESVGRGGEAGVPRVIAILLVGGSGTRLRPLTDWLPKPMVPIANRPFLEHQIAHLRRHGVTRVILSCGYMPDAIRDHFGDSLEYVVEDPPLGTGGAIENAARGLEETFLVGNGDVLTDLDVSALVEFHRTRQARATIALHPVDDPSRYGLVRDRRATARSTAFIEKPKPGEADVDTVNAGTYVMEPDVLVLIPPGRPGVGRARGVPAAGRGRPVRAAATGLLARHRHARELPGGEPASDAGGRADRPHGGRSTRPRR